MVAEHVAYTDYYFGDIVPAIIAIISISISIFLGC